jgi:hypothetical protein
LVEEEGVVEMDVAKEEEKHEINRPSTESHASVAGVGLVQERKV